MTPERPPEFEEDLIALDEYRNPRIRPITPDPRLAQAIIEQQQAQFWIAVTAATAIFVFVLAIAP